MTGKGSGADYNRDRTSGAGEADLGGGFSVMFVRDHQDSLELLPTEQYPLGEQCGGDTRFSVRVRFAGFTAEMGVWVSATTLAAFTEQLHILEQRRQGAAALESMTPGEFRLEIRTYDRAGHVGTFGRVGRRCQGGVGGPHECVVAFGIPFCPSRLPELVAEFQAIVAGRVIPPE